MPRFEIIGTGKETRRKRKRVYTAFDEQIARKNAEDDGTVVETINLLPANPPTKHQLELAEHYNVDISMGSTEDDVSDIINTKFNNERYAQREDRDIANYFKIEVTDFIGEDSLFRKIKNELSKPGREKDLVLFFIYCVYNDYTRGMSGNSKIFLDNSVMKDISNVLYKDNQVIKSIKRYDGDSIKYFGEKTSEDGYTRIYGSKRTEAYKAVIALLKENALLPKRSVSKTIVTNKDSNVFEIRKSNTKKRRTFSIAEIITIIVLVLILFYILF